MLKGLNITEDNKSLSIHLFANTLDITITTIPGIRETLGGNIEYIQPSVSRFIDSNKAVEEVSEYFNRLERLIKAPAKPAPAK